MTDTGRSSLTVIIPVHRKFITEAIKRDAGYQERILSALGSGSLRLTEISAAMGYLGITKKLSDTVAGPWFLEVCLCNSPARRGGSSTE